MTLCGSDAFLKCLPAKSGKTRLLPVEDRGERNDLFRPDPTQDPARGRSVTAARKGRSGTRQREAASFGEAATSPTRRIDPVAAKTGGDHVVRRGEERGLSERREQRLSHA